MRVRIAAGYLWWSPLAVAPLFVVYHRFGLWARVIVGLAQFALAVMGLHARGALDQRMQGSGLGPGPVLLVIGGALVWISGASGPPDPADVLMPHYNNGGLTVGFLVTFLGLVAITPALVANGESILASIGLACFALMSSCG